MKDVRYTSGDSYDDLVRRIKSASDYETITFSIGRVTFTGSSYVEHWDCSAADSYRAECMVIGCTPESAEAEAIGLKHPRFWECYS